MSDNESPAPPPSSPNANRRFQIEGVDLGYPTLFHDGQSVAGLYVVKSRVANEYIKESGFEVAEIAPGRTILTLTGVHYTDTQCGSYNEMAFAFLVKEVGGKPRIPYLSSWSDLVRGKVRSFTWKLQVNTTLSQYCGIEMWGFPKTLEEIDYDCSKGRATFNMTMDGRQALNFSLKAEGNQTPEELSSPVYSIFEGAQHVGYLTQNYRDTGYFPFGAELTLGDHPFADELRALGLPKKPLLATYNGHLNYHMSEPRKL
jgi:hypothetical protein